MIHFLIGFPEARDLIRLRSFGPLDDVELNFIALFEALVPLALDGTVVNEDVCPAVAAEEAVALCIVKPFYGALILCQWSDSLTVQSVISACRELKALQR
jgi:hypothetical protein